jgi:hypothetical protein
LLVRHRTCAAQDSAFPCDLTTGLRVGDPAIARSFPRLDTISIRDPGSDTKFGAEVLNMLCFHRTEAPAHEPRISLAERRCGEMGWKLPPGIAAPCDSAERTAPATTASGLRSLLPSGPHARWQGHSRSAPHREQPWQRSDRHFAPVLKTSLRTLQNSTAAERPATFTPAGFAVAGLGFGDIQPHGLSRRAYF